MLFFLSFYGFGVQHATASFYNVQRNVWHIIHFAGNIGAGAGGLTAAIYAREANKSVLIKQIK